MSYSPSQVLARVIDETTPDLRLKNAPLLDYFGRKGRVKPAPSRKLEWNAIVKGSASARAAMTTAGTDQAVGDAEKAELSIGSHKFYSQFTVERVALFEAQKAGVGALKNLLEQNISGSILAIRRDINEALWNGTGNAASAGLAGLAVISNPTAAYAGIDPATVPTWIPVVNTNATPRALTRDLLYDFSTQIEIAETYHDSLFCNTTMGQEYTQLFDVVAGNLSVNSDGSNKDLAMGTRSYNGAPIITDPQAPTDRIVGIRDLDMEVLSIDLADASQSKMTELGFNPNFTAVSSAEVGGLIVNVAMLPSANPAVLQFQLFSCVQLRCYNRKGVQVLEKLTV